MIGEGDPCRLGGPKELASCLNFLKLFKGGTGMVREGFVGLD